MVPYYWLKPMCSHGILRSEPCHQCKRDPVRTAKFEAEFLRKVRAPSAGEPVK